jgi:transmembrane sensor
MDRSTSSSSPRRQVVSEACAWFIEFRAGEATATTRERFDQWLRHSPEHIQAYLEVAAAWSELPTSDSQGRIDIDTLLGRARESLEEDVVVSLGAHRSACAEPTEGSEAPRRRATRFGPLAVAASIGVLVTIACVLGWLNLRDRDTYTTGIGEQRTIRLADDSIVDLNARSKLRVRFSNALRAVDLVAGQALFHVAKDPQRPFVVLSDSMAVRAVGTEFDVYRKGDGLVVTVVEGRVAVLPPNAQLEAPAAAPSRSSAKGSAATGIPQLLSAGEQLTVTPRAASPPHRADVNTVTAWVRRRLIFEDTPLAEVAEEFNRYSVRRLIIDDPELARQPISGVYSSSDPSSLVGFLRAQPSLQVLETDQEIRVARREAAGRADGQ